MTLPVSRRRVLGSTIDGIPVGTQPPAKHGSVDASQGNSKNIDKHAIQIMR